jgi:hypothetical protein
LFIGATCTLAATRAGMGHGPSVPSACGQTTVSADSESDSDSASWPMEGRVVPRAADAESGSPGCVALPQDAPVPTDIGSGDAVWRITAGLLRDARETLHHVAIAQEAGVLMGLFVRTSQLPSLQICARRTCHMPPAIQRA